jgi:two-component system, LytTR family, response regulator
MTACMKKSPSINAIESPVLLPRFRTRSGEHSIDARRIIYLSGNGNYTIFHLATGEQVITTLSLSAYSPLLEIYGFIRVHKSHLLNTHYLDMCQWVRLSELTLPNGKTIEVARRRRKTIKKMVKNSVL